MEHFDPAPWIKNSQKVTDIFGRWPSFHDAEIQEVRLFTADGEPWSIGSDSPVMEMAIHFFEMTKDVTPEGYFVLKNHTLARFKFCNVEDLELSDFWYQNCIFGLEFGTQTVSYPQGQRNGNAVDLLTVQINSSVGLRGHFRCRSAEVLSAELCDARGRMIFQPES
ncbi:MAG: Imm50 family immunity protein [Acidobacteriota bacterium]